MVPSSRSVSCCCFPWPPDSLWTVATARRVGPYGAAMTKTCRSLSDRWLQVPGRPSGRAAPVAVARGGGRQVLLLGTAVTAAALVFLAMYDRIAGTSRWYADGSFVVFLAVVSAGFWALRREGFVVTAVGPGWASRAGLLRSWEVHLERLRHVARQPMPYAADFWLLSDSAGGRTTLFQSWLNAHPEWLSALSDEIERQVASGSVTRNLVRPMLELAGRIPEGAVRRSAD